MATQRGMSAAPPPPPSRRPAAYPEASTRTHPPPLSHIPTRAEARSPAAAPSGKRSKSAASPSGPARWQWSDAAAAELLSILVSPADERKRMAARNDHKGIHELNKSAAKVLAKAYQTEVFHAKRVKAKAKNMQAQWRTINEAVTLLRNNGAFTTAVESKEVWHTVVPLYA